MTVKFGACPLAYQQRHVPPKRREKACVSPLTQHNKSLNRLNINHCHLWVLMLSNDSRWGEYRPIQMLSWCTFSSNTCSFKMIQWLAVDNTNMQIVSIGLKKTAKAVEKPNYLKSGFTLVQSLGSKKAVEKKPNRTKHILKLCRVHSN